MALTVTDFAPVQITMDATPGDATQVFGPVGARSVRLQGVTDPAWWSTAGADGAAMGDDYNSAPAGSSEYAALNRDVPVGSRPFIFLGSDATVAEIKVQFSREKA